MTNPSYNLSETIEAAKQTIATTREEVRAYIPAVMQRLAITFGLPVLAALLEARRDSSHAKAMAKAAAAVAATRAESSALAAAAVAPATLE